MVLKQTVHDIEWKLNTEYIQELKWVVCFLFWKVERKSCIIYTVLDASLMLELHWLQLLPLFISC